jgi:hypothetical protein
MTTAGRVSASRSAASSPVGGFLGLVATGGHGAPATAAGPAEVDEEPQAVGIRTYPKPFWVVHEGGDRVLSDRSEHLADARTASPAEGAVGCDLRCECRPRGPGVQEIALAQTRLPTASNGVRDQVDRLPELTRMDEVSSRGTGVAREPRRRRPALQVRRSREPFERRRSATLAQGSCERKAKPAAAETESHLRFEAGVHGLTVACGTG